jgi:hypothetical protein
MGVARRGSARILAFGICGSGWSGNAGRSANFVAQRDGRAGLE